MFHLTLGYGFILPSEWRILFIRILSPKTALVVNIIPFFSGTVVISTCLATLQDEKISENLNKRIFTMKVPFKK